MSEIDAADKWITAQLTGDAALAALVGARIYDGEAPPGAAYPLVTWTAASPPRDVMAEGGERILSIAVYLVQVFGQGRDYGLLRPIANRIDELLHQARGTVTDGVVFGCVRESAVKLAETYEGQSYRRLGGYYRLWVQAA